MPNYPKFKIPPVPEDCMSIDNAAVATGYCRKTIQDKLRRKELAGVCIVVVTPAGNVVNFRFPKRDAVLALQDALRSTKRPAARQESGLSDAPLLIHPSDSVALQARRELWCRNNRKFRKIG